MTSHDTTACARETAILSHDWASTPRSLKSYTSSPPHNKDHHAATRTTSVDSSDRRLGSFHREGLDGGGTGCHALWGKAPGSSYH